MLKIVLQHNRSKADIAPYLSHVRFAPESGHRSGHPRRQLLAKAAIAASRVAAYPRAALARRT
jgi:hypothetical protein